MAQQITARVEQINAELARHGVNEPATTAEVERTASLYWPSTAAADILAGRVRTATFPPAGPTEDEIHEANEDGYDVGVRGGRYSTNPHDKLTATDLHDAWAGGWEQGAKVLAEVRAGA